MHSETSNKGKHRMINEALPGFIVLTLVSLGVAAALLSGCNTVEGAGKDIERGGEKLQGAAEGAK